MYPVSDTYRAILAAPHRVENKLVIKGKDYTRAQIVDLRKYTDVFRDECPSIGNCCAGTISIEMLCPEEEIPVTERVELCSRIVGSGQVSEWIPKGRYYIDKRKKNLVGSGEETTMEISGYNGIMKLEAIYPAGGEWPKTDNQVLQEILQLLDLESDEVLPGCEIKRLDDDLTCREVMGYIAASHGANWIEDGSGKLMLLRLGQSRGAGTVKVKSLSTGDVLSPISRVELHDGEGTVYASGTDGRTIYATCPWATQEMADSILSQVAGYQYRPFTAEEAICNPALEIGDDIGIGIIYSEDTELFDGMLSQLAAPPEEEINHKYPFKSGAGGVASRAMAKAKETNRDHKELVAKVGTIEAGIEANVVKYGDMENGEWIDAHTAVFAAAQGKRAAFDIWVAGQSEGVLESAATLVADFITLRGKLDVIGMLSVYTASGEVVGIATNGGIVANGNVVCDSVNATDGYIRVAPYRYKEREITFVSSASSAYISNSGGPGAQAIETPTGVKYFHPGSYSTKTVHALVRVASNDTQNFAFDMEES